MNITYREGKSFQPQELKDLFLSVQWSLPPNIQKNW